MAFHNVPPNGFPDIPDIEDLEAVQGDIKTLQTTTGELGTAITGLTTNKAPKTDIAVAFSAESNYAVGDLVYYEGVLYKCTTAHEAAAWNAEDFTAASVGSVASSLMSGLINVQDDVKLNTQDLTTPSRTKNLLAMTLNGIKSANTLGTWAGNTYTYLGITYELLTDSADNIISIYLSQGTATAESVVRLYNVSSLANGSYFVNGCPSGGSGSSYRLRGAGGLFGDLGVGASFTKTDETESYVEIVVSSGYTIPIGGLTFRPMIVLSTETDRTFAPYVPSVESRLEAVESGLTNVNGKLIQTEVTYDSTTDTFKLPTGVEPPRTASQITLLARNRSNGSIYVLWYKDGHGFSIGSTLVGSAPTDGLSVTVQYIG